MLLKLEILTRPPDNGCPPAKTSAEPSAGNDVAGLDLLHYASRVRFGGRRHAHQTRGVEEEDDDRCRDYPVSSDPIPSIAARTRSAHGRAHEQKMKDNYYEQNEPSNIYI